MASAAWHNGNETEAGKSYGMPFGSYIIFLFFTFLLV
jgi:hypothetical protein